MSTPITQKSTGLDALDRATGTDSKLAEKRQLAEAARQFEAIFTKQLLEAMGKTSRDSSSMGASAGLYDDMMHQAVAEHMSQGRGAGIGGLLYRQWTGETLEGLAAGDDLPRTSRRPMNLPTGAGVTPGASATASGVTRAPEGFGLAAPSGGGGLPGVDMTVASKPGRYVDDGIRPLRDMLPPTGLEEIPSDFSKKELNPSLERPDLSGASTSTPTGDGQGELNGHQERHDATDARLAATDAVAGSAARRRRVAERYANDGSVR